jgi:hypothetical protein
LKYQLPGKISDRLKSNGAWIVHTTLNLQTNGITEGDCGSRTIYVTLFGYVIPRKSVSGVE